MMLGCAPSAWSCCGSCTRRRARALRSSGRRRLPRWRKPAALTSLLQPQLERCVTSGHCRCQCLLQCRISSCPHVPMTGPLVSKKSAGESKPMGGALEHCARAVLGSIESFCSAGPGPKGERLPAERAVAPAERAAPVVCCGRQRLPPGGAAHVARCHARPGQRPPPRPQVRWQV